MAASRRVLFLFVDGLGLGPRDASINPVYSGESPFLAGLIDRQSVAIDATMDVPGIPQSATGQTALLTGINAARVLGRHKEAFPGPDLKQIIRAGNIFMQVLESGGRATFANGYTVKNVRELDGRRRHSVTTVAALSALHTVRCLGEIERNEAVYQDLTRESLRDKGYNGPLISPEEAALHLVTIAQEHELTLFEYFQTDRAGHMADMDEAVRVLTLLNRFVRYVLDFAEGAGLTVVLTSDHGNVEDIRSGKHTRNPVPFIADGPGAGRLRQRVHCITDVTPALVEWLSRGSAT